MKFKTHDKADAGPHIGDKSPVTALNRMFMT